MIDMISSLLQQVVLFWGSQSSRSDQLYVYLGIYGSRQLDKCMKFLPIAHTKHTKGIYKTP